MKDKKKNDKLLAVALSLSMFSTGAAFAADEETINLTIDTLNTEASGMVSDSSRQTSELHLVTEENPPTGEYVIVHIGVNDYWYNPNTTKYTVNEWQHIANIGSQALTKIDNGTTPFYTLNGEKLYYDTSKLPQSAYTLAPADSDYYSFSKQVINNEGKPETHYYKADIKLPEGEIYQISKTAEAGKSFSIPVVKNGQQAEEMFTINIDSDKISSGRMDNMTWGKVQDDTLPNTIKVNLPNQTSSTILQYNVTTTEGTYGKIYTTPLSGMPDKIGTNEKSDLFHGINGQHSRAITNQADHHDINIYADFINNSGTDNDGGAAIWNQGTNGQIAAIGDINGQFINNISSGANIQGGAIYNFSTSGAQTKIGNITGDFIGNAAISNTTGNIGAGGAIYIHNDYVDKEIGNTTGNITGNFIGNHSYGGENVGSGAFQGAGGGAIYVEGSSSIGDVSGNFIANWTQSDNPNAGARGGAICLDGLYSSGININIKSNFIGNFAKAKRNAYGGGIYTSHNTYIHLIEGDFIGNKAESGWHKALGGGICNLDDDIGNITGTFIGNSAISEGDKEKLAKNWAAGGGIYSTNIIGNVTADFIGNYAETTNFGDALGGAISNNADTTTPIMGNLTGDNIQNHVKATNGDAYGGAVKNSGYMGDITGYQAHNFAEGTNAFGGAIYNNGILGNITGNFYDNHVNAQNVGLGGALNNEVNKRYQEPEYVIIGNIEGEFNSNSVNASEGEAYGGAIANYNYANIAGINSIFINNSANSNKGNAIGGALANFAGGYIPDVEGAFINNTASSTENSAFGGAVFNAQGGEIDNISSSFTNNHAEGELGAYGGAIYNDNTINIVTKNKDIEFKGNYVKGNAALGGAIYNDQNGQLGLYASKDNEITFVGDSDVPDAKEVDSIHNEGKIEINGTNYTGTVNLSKVTDNSETSLGVININNGYVFANDDITQKELNIYKNGKLTSNADYLHISNPVQDAGTIDFTGGTISYNIAGDGNVNIKSGNTVTSNAETLDFTGKVTIEDNATLKIEKPNTGYFSKVSNLTINGTFDLQNNTDSDTTKDKYDNLTYDEITVGNNAVWKLDFKGDQGTYTEETPGICDYLAANKVTADSTAKGMGLNVKILSEDVPEETWKKITNETLASSISNVKVDINGYKAVYAGFDQKTGVLHLNPGSAWYRLNEAWEDARDEDIRYYAPGEDDPARRDLGELQGTSLTINMIDDKGNNSHIDGDGFKGGSVGVYTDEEGIQRQQIVIIENANIDGFDGDFITDNDGIIEINNTTIDNSMTNGEGSITFTDSTLKDSLNNLKEKGTVTYDNSKMEGDITNKGTVNFDNSKTTGSISNEGTVNIDNSETSGDISNEGTANFSNSKASGNISNDATVNFDNSETSGNISNDGILNSDGESKLSTIDGTGQTNFTVGETANLEVNYDITQSEVVFQHEEGTATTGSATVYNKITGNVINKLKGDELGEGLTISNDINGNITNTPDSYLAFTNEVNVDGKLNNYAVTDNTGNTAINNVDNTGTINNTGTLTLKSDSNNSGIINNTDTLNLGTINKSANIVNEGSVLGDTGKTVIYANVDNKGVIIQKDVEIKNGGYLTTDLHNITVTNADNVITNDGTLEITSAQDNTIDVNINGSGTGKVDLNIPNTTLDSTIIANDINFHRGVLDFGPNADISNATLSINPGAESMNLQDGIIRNHSFGSINLNTNITVPMDFNLVHETMDTINIANNGNFTNSGGNFMLMSGLPQETKDVLTNPHIILSPFSDEHTRVSMKESMALIPQTITSPIYNYKASYDAGSGLINIVGGGDYKGFNSAVLAAPVAAQLGGYIALLHNYEDAFGNMDMIMAMTYEQRQTMKARNRYAAADDAGLVTYSPTLIPEERSGIWFRPFSTFERVDLNNGPSVGNNFYGGLVGADSKIIEFKNGWDGVFTGYAGYTGSHQYFDGTSTWQNGGLGGATAIFYKGNFFTGLTASVGASVADVTSSYGREDITMLLAGVASKTGYNFEFFNGHFIVQPTWLMSYSFVNTFDHTAASGVKVGADPIHAIQLVPGLKLLGNLPHGWQPYASVQMVWNLMDKTRFYANNVYLPEMTIDPYIQYGVGLQKRWGDKCTGYAQVVLRNGGRTGIAMSGGFRWALGKNTEPMKTSKGIETIEGRTIKLAANQNNN